MFIFLFVRCLPASPALSSVGQKEFIIHSTDISYGGRAAEVLFVYSKYSDEDTVDDVLCITRQVDSLLSRSPSPTSSLRDCFCLHLSLLNRWWCGAADAAQRSIAQQRSDNNESGTNWIGLWPKISWCIKKAEYVINKVQLRSGNVRNVWFPIRKINGVVQLFFFKCQNLLFCVPRKYKSRLDVLY